MPRSDNHLQIADEYVAYWSDVAEHAVFVRGVVVLCKGWIAHPTTVQEHQRQEKAHIM